VDVFKQFRGSESKRYNPFTSTVTAPQVQKKVARRSYNISTVIKKENSENNSLSNILTVRK